MPRALFHSASINWAIAKSDCVGINGVGGDEGLRGSRTVEGGTGVPVASMLAASGVSTLCDAFSALGAPLVGTVKTSAASVSAVLTSSGVMDCRLSGLLWLLEDHEGGVSPNRAPRSPR